MVHGRLYKTSRSRPLLMILGDLLDLRFGNTESCRAAFERLAVLVSFRGRLITLGGSFEDWEQFDMVRLYKGRQRTAAQHFYW